MYGWKSTTSLQEADWVTMLKRTSLRCVGTATGACIKISLLTYQVHLLLTDLIPPEDERQGVGQRLPYHPPVDRQLLATPWIVPVPCSYSYRICSNSSTLALLSKPYPSRAVSSEDGICFYGLGLGEIRVSKSWSTLAARGGPESGLRSGVFHSAV